MAHGIHHECGTQRTERLHFRGLWGDELATPRLTRIKCFIIL